MKNIITVLFMTLSIAFAQESSFGEAKPYPKPVPCEKEGKKIAKLVTKENLTLQDSFLLAKFDDGLLLRSEKITPPTGWSGVERSENKVVFVDCDSLPEVVRKAVGGFDSKKASAARAQREAAKDSGAGEPFGPELIGNHLVIFVTDLALNSVDPYFKGRSVPRDWKDSEPSAKAK